MRRELRTFLSDKIFVVSVNDMAKIKVGVQVVSQYHQINQIFSEKDGPVLNDHDFPVIFSQLLDTDFFKMKKRIMYDTTKGTATPLKFYLVPNQIFKK